MVLGDTMWPKKETHKIARLCLVVVYSDAPRGVSTWWWVFQTPHGASLLGGVLFRCPTGRLYLVLLVGGHDVDDGDDIGDVDVFVSVDVGGGNEGGVACHGVDDCYDIGDVDHTVTVDIAFDFVVGVVLDDDVGAFHDGASLHDIVVGEDGVFGFHGSDLTW